MMNPLCCGSICGFDARGAWLPPERALRRQSSLTEKQGFVFGGDLFDTVPLQFGLRGIGRKRLHVYLDRGPSYSSTSSTQELK
jgi:hypothetical protein